jgi:hypothetical protein
MDFGNNVQFAGVISGEKRWLPHSYAMRNTFSTLNVSRNGSEKAIILARCAGYL